VLNFVFRRIKVFIPSTFTANIRNKLLRTRIIGETARFLAISRVTDAIVYYEKSVSFETKGLGKYISKILNYAVTPQTEKKIAFPLSEENKYFGVIPPLELKVHESGFVKNVGWGIVKKTGGKYLLITCEERKFLSKDGVPLFWRDK